MTGPRLPHTKAAPTLTGGDDRPLGRCVEDYWPFDQMLDHKPDTPQHRHAKQLAGQVCGSCPLTCAFRVRGVAPCGTNAAYNRHIKRREKPCDPCRRAHAADEARRRAA